MFANSLKYPPMSISMFRANKSLSISSVTARRFAHTENLYDIMKLQRNCSEKDVRDAFVKLSKECHPDSKCASSDSNATARFTKIMEAYKVLSKKDSRAAYDIRLNTGGRTIIYPPNGMSNNNNEYWNINNKRTGRNPETYYGVKGINKVSNYKIAGILLWFATLGIIALYSGMKKSFTFNMKQLENDSKQTSIAHAKARENAEKHGNRMQLERLKNTLSRTSGNG